LGFLALIVLSSGCTFFGWFMDVLSTDDSSDNFIVLNKTTNGTYFVAGVSFKCPHNWHVGVIKEKGGTIIVAAPMLREINNTSISASTFGPFGFESGGVAWSSADPQFEADIIYNNGMAEQEAINMVKNNMLPGNKISSDKIIIDGRNAFKDVVIFNETVEIMRFEYIYFVKNEKTYLITFSDLHKNFDKEKKNFEMILNSFKVQ